MSLYSEANNTERRREEREREREREMGRHGGDEDGLQAFLDTLSDKCEANVTQCVAIAGGSTFACVLVIIVACSINFAWAQWSVIGRLKRLLQLLLLNR